MTRLPRKLYPDCKEKKPGFTEVLTESKDLLDLFLFTLPSPNVAKAPTAVTAKISTMANFLQEVFSM